ncbi:MAG TPA: SDR family oxidoreductase [Vicinamibacteria bacterium]|nr:SDR family oxidoreductase [Vicinamibacteria bacterium]
MAAYTGKVVVVTGASSGIGKALCLALAEQRSRLVLAARDASSLEAVASACREKGADTLVVPADVTSEEACRLLVEKAVERFKVIDVLVNNAGVGMLARFDEVKDLAPYEQLMRVNYLGSVYPTYHALPHLKASHGQIVVVASLAGLTGVPTRTAYAASKHALFGFFDSLRIELLGTGVSVTMVAPDFVLSEIHRRAFGPDGLPLGQSPLRESKIMTAEECARLIVHAMERRKRLLVTSARGRFGRYVRLVFPGFIDRIARRAVARGV